MFVRLVVFYLRESFLTATMTSHAKDSDCSWQSVCNFKVLMVNLASSISLDFVLFLVFYLFSVQPSVIISQVTSL
jgi:hypothetical protein